MIKRILSGGLALIALAGAAFAGFGDEAPAHEVAGESLDLLKAMRPYSALAQAALPACVTAIAQVKRLETRKDAPEASIHAAWVHAAGRCRSMAAAVCEAAALQAPRDACRRVRTHERAL